MTARVALVTCGELPELDDDERLVIAPLAARGITAVPTVWDDPTVDWTSFDLVVIRSAWDYPDRRDEFVQWARGVPRLCNPRDIVDWNTDKRYLKQLAAAGVPVVPTTWHTPTTPPWRPEPVGEWVVKPAVGAGSRDAGRYLLTDPNQYALAVGHVARLTATQRVAMVQPYLPAVDSHGETALVYFGGRYSHAIRKSAMLTGPYEPRDGLFKPEEITTREPTEVERAIADRVLAAVPGGSDRLLYARVDLLPGPDGSPVLVELELTEPSLFLSNAAGAAERFADAIAKRLTAS